VFWAASIVAVSVWRAAFREALRVARRHGYNQRYALVVGGGDPAAEVLRVLRRRPDAGIRVLGLLGDKREVQGSAVWRRSGRSSTASRSTSSSSPCRTATLCVSRRS
jgi:FlaA1/EpsC-like NDP-sugar epimerase